MISVPIRFFAQHSLPMQAMTVSGLTMTKAERHLLHTCDSPTQNKRSELCNCRRFLVERLRDYDRMTNRDVFQLESSAAFQ